jgi:hypothetical protein
MSIQTIVLEALTSGVLTVEHEQAISTAIDRGHCTGADLKAMDMLFESMENGMSHRAPLKTCPSMIRWRDTIYFLR